MFADRSRLDVLNRLVWPRIVELSVKEFEERAQRADARPVGVLEAAVLIEAGWTQMVDEVWSIQVPPQVALARIQARDGLSLEAAQARMAAQLANDSRARFARVVIDTNRPKQETRALVEQEWSKLRERIALAENLATRNEPQLRA